MEKALDPFQEMERRRLRPQNDERHEDATAKANFEFMQAQRERYQKGLERGNRIDRRVEVRNFIRSLRERYASQIAQNKRFLEGFSLYNLINDSGGGAPNFDLPDRDIEEFLKRFSGEQAA